MYDSIAFLSRCVHHLLPRYARIDGSTTLEDREKAIQEFNKPKSSEHTTIIGTAKHVSAKASQKCH